jgi:hypothetical protein
MARDIEDFLRKAAERRQNKKGGGAPRQQPPPRQPAQRQPPLRRQVPQEPIIIDDVEIVEAHPVARPVQPKKRSAPKKSSIRSGSVSDHVKSHINTSDIAAHAENLGDRISDVHDQVESRIHQRLDHDLSTIDDTRSVTEEPPPAIVGARSSRAADNLRQMLSNPKSAAQAILVAEILKRPNIK